MCLSGVCPFSVLRISTAHISKVCTSSCENCNFNTAKINSPAIPGRCNLLQFLVAEKSALLAMSRMTACGPLSGCNPSSKEQVSRSHLYSGRGPGLRPYGHVRALLPRTSGPARYVADV